MSMASCQTAFQANMVYGHRPSPFNIYIMISLFIYLSVMDTGSHFVRFSCFCCDFEVGCFFLKQGVRELLALRMCKLIEDSS